MLLKTAIVIAVAITGFLLYVAMQPSEMLISREVLIKGTPEEIFPHLNSSKKAHEWMPWQESDPEAKMVFEGPEEGVGSKTSWDSKGKMGTGEALVVESVPGKTVKTQLTYTKPMQMSQLAEVSLNPTGEGTMVRWSVTGHNTFVGRLACAFMNMDKMVGGQFEKGLAKLKSKVEAR